MLFDTLETVFGPDPGLLRLNTAARAAGAAAISLTILLLLTGGQTRPQVTAIALGFMMAVMSNMAVRDPQQRAQMLTLALLPLPVLAAVALAFLLSQSPWLGKLCFVAVATAAVLARLLGPRGTAFGMVAFIGYFIGEIMSVPFTALPLAALGTCTGIAASALMRFIVLPDRPANTLRHIERHLRRRTARILRQAARMLRGGAGREKHEHRMHRELVRLNDAFQAAEEQLQSLGATAAAQALEQRFFAVELAAERLIRLAAEPSPEAERNQVLPRIDKLAALLLHGDLPPPRPTPPRPTPPRPTSPRPTSPGAAPPATAPQSPRHTPLTAALDALEDTLSQLARAPTTTPHKARQ